MALLGKDSALALDAARTAGRVLPVGEAAAQRFALALQAGLAQADDAALWRWIDVEAQSEAAATRGRESEIAL